MCLFGFYIVKSKKYLKGVYESFFIITRPYLVVYKLEKICFIILFSVTNHRIASDHISCLTK